MLGRLFIFVLSRRGDRFSTLEAVNEVRFRYLLFGWRLIFWASSGIGHRKLATLNRHESRSQSLSLQFLPLHRFDFRLRQSEDSMDAVYPQRPIKVIVPFSAGGGSDTFARIIQRAIEDQELLPEPLVIVNVPGAGGTIGSRRVKDARPDGYTLLLLHDGIMTAQHSGQAAYGPEAFEPVAGTGDVGLVIAVTDDSPYQSLEHLMRVVVDEPDTILFSANLVLPFILPD